MILTLQEIGNPSAYWQEHCPTEEEISERTNASGDYESASETVFSKRQPDEFDGDTDAILVNEATGETIRYNYGTGECYTKDGELLPSEFADAAYDAGVPKGNASDDESLKMLIAEVEPLIGSPENVTLISEECECDDRL